MLSGADLWADAPAPEPTPPASQEPAPPWWWDVNPWTENSLLRARDGSLLLAVIRDGQSWGIWQIQRGEWDLIQIRGDRSSALAEALAGARRAGLIDS